MQKFQYRRMSSLTAVMLWDPVKKSCCAFQLRSTFYCCSWYIFFLNGWQNWSQFHEAINVPMATVNVQDHWNKQPHPKLTAETKQHLGCNCQKTGFWSKYWRDGIRHSNWFIHAKLLSSCKSCPNDLHHQKNSIYQNNPAGITTF